MRNDDVYCRKRKERKREGGGPEGYRSFQSHNPPEINFQFEVEEEGGLLKNAVLELSGFF